MDNNPIWKNIGNFIKYSFTGDKAIAEIQKSLTNPSPHSSNVPPSKNQGERYRS
ncbi:MAG: hypothetical protein AB8U82_05535 [Rickettsia endosymbiont of Haemaphysalis japonica]